VRWPLARLALGAALLLAVALVLTAPAGQSSSLPLTPSHVGGTASAQPVSAGPPVHEHGADGPSAHEAAEGFVLVAAADRTTPQPAARCDPAVPVRSYAVAAIAVDITINRYLDHDPEGRMYVLEDDLPRVRDEEARNAAARQGRGEPAVTIGLQGDAIQPLALRVDQGECLRIRLRNALPGAAPAGLQLHGSSLHVVGSVLPAIETNPAAYAASGSSVTYEWMVRADEPEGTHYFHGLGDDRIPTSHGLFGAVIVEPRGARFLDPLSGQELRTGWSAVITTLDGRSFREAVLYYHEIGDETYQLLDRDGGFVPLVDPFTGAYRPGARALNYRSEPFMDRLALQQRLTGGFDESLSYSSYTFGDPATPIVRSYLGDPIKQRLVHGGSEVFHVHHVHGGAIRWLRQPGVEPTRFDTGLVKHPPLVPQASERIDSQSVGPSETFDLENECGSGGCQQSAGDYLIHCHVAHHYFAGMWTIWRVYNTLQDGSASTDALPPLRELPDRGGRVAPAVTSAGIIGRTLERGGAPITLGADGLPGWVEPQLPPRGVRHGYDAAVWNWSREGTTYLGEPEDERAWPGFASRAPGTRPPLLFDPNTGKLAYPFLRPHLGERPPFAPGHGPAPFLDPFFGGTSPPAPGANGPASVCPAGTTVRTFAVNAVNVPVPLNRRGGLIDPAGELYVLREQQDLVRAEDRARIPLTIRANAGEDCVDLVLRSDLADGSDAHGFSKVNLHIHFVQFDVQASDGVITGFNYEQSVRPFAAEGEKVVTAAAAGETSVRLSDTGRFQAGALVGVGMGQDPTFEVRRIVEVSADRLRFDEPLRFAHERGEFVSSEFVRYRWYPDVQFGTAYFHDHVNAIDSWRRGLFGALISEPPGSTYHDPHTGAEIRSGLLADVHTTGNVSVDVSGSFREAAMFIQDDNPITHIGRSSGSSLNLRAEPPAARGGDPTLFFSSIAHGDPATPVIEANLGDPVVVRLLVGGTNDVHTWHLDGHTFRAEPHSSTSPPIDTIHLGISERYDLSIGRAGGPQGLPGDYLYYSGRSVKLAEGSWGILRVRGPGDGSPLRPLPGHEVVPAPAAAICPPGAPARELAVSAIEAPLPMLGGSPGRIFVADEDEAATRSGARPPEPLVLHVNVGDCVRVRLTNTLSDTAVSFHADMLAFDPRDSAGVAAGTMPPQAVAPGASRTYTYYASPEVGETVALVRDWGDVLRSPGLGLYGAIVVGPRGATYSDPRTGADLGSRSSWAVDVHPPTAPAYRDFALFLQDEDAGIGTHRMPYTKNVDGIVGLNYGSAPLPVDPLEAAAVFRGAAASPRTPVLDTNVGDPVRVHVLLPWSEQGHVFSIEGHRWPLEPGRVGTQLLSSQQVGGLEAITLFLEGGGGGGDALPGDYVYGDRRAPYRQAGLWGILRVRARCDAAGPDLRALPHLDVSCPSGTDTGPLLAAGGGALFAVAFSALILARRRLKVRSP